MFQASSTWVTRCKKTRCQFRFMTSKRKLRNPLITTDWFHELTRPLLKIYLVSLWFHLTPGHRAQLQHPLNGHGRFRQIPPGRRGSLPAFAGDAVDILATFHISIDGKPHIQVSSTIEAHSRWVENPLSHLPFPPRKKQISTEMFIPEAYDDSTPISYAFFSVEQESVNMFNSGFGLGYKLLRREM